MPRPDVRPERAAGADRAERPKWPQADEFLADGLLPNGYTPNGLLPVRPLADLAERLRSRARYLALVGGGGKTTLLFTLARLWAEAGEAVICTVTTRIRPPRPEQSGLWLRDDATGPPCPLPGEVLTLAARLVEPDKLFGLGPDEIAGLRRSGQCTLVEADGAACRPLKAPAPHEPVIPPDVQGVVALAGLESLGATLDPPSPLLHRPERLRRLAEDGPDFFPGLPREDFQRVTPALLALLAVHPDGFFRNAPAGCLRLCCLNKADAAPDAAAASALAAAALPAASPPEVQSRLRAVAEAAALARSHNEDLVWIGASLAQGWICPASPWSWQRLLHAD